MEIGNFRLRMGDGGGDELWGKRKGNRGHGLGTVVASVTARPGHLPAVLPLLIPTPDSEWTRCSLSKAT